MRSAPGTYVLILRSERACTVQIGRRGPLSLAAGFYAYIGSAFGPGGVRARVRRHCRGTGSRHWHIDYLRAVAAPVAVWFSHAPRRLEHAWAAMMAAMPDAEAVPDFGCSDCRCRAHLFRFAAMPDRAWFARRADGKIVEVPIASLAAGDGATPVRRRAARR